MLAGQVAIGAAAAAGLWRYTNLIVPHYAPTPYDDLLSRLVDRGHAARLGAAMPHVDARIVAARLRATLGSNNLKSEVENQITSGQMTEAAGWVMPECVGLLSALAAHA